MRARAVFGAALTALIVFAAAPAQAAGACRDVMAKTGFTTSQILDNSFLTAIAYGHLKTTKFEQRNTKKVLGAPFPAGDALLGKDASPDDLLSLQKSLEDIDLRGLGPAVFDDTAISSGDEAVHAAWSACMAGQSGPMIWFETIDARTAILRLRGGAGKAEVLSEDIAILPGFRVRAGDECLESGRPITAKGCSATITTSDYQRPLSLIVNTSQGTARAYWAPRLRFTTDIEKYQSLVTRAETVRAASPEYLQQRVFMMRPSLAEEGWRFRPSKVVLSAPEKTRGPFGDCLRGGVQVSDTSITFTYGFNNKIDALLSCKWTITAEVYRTKVEPID